MAKSRVQKLEEALSYLENGKGIDLGNDVFLVGKELDGSDKCYGFGKVNDRVQIVTRASSDGYPVTDMDKEDLQYMFGLSNVFEKIKNKQYEEVDYEDI